MFRANDIEADDTSAVIMMLAGGHRLTTAVTLAAAHTRDPYVDVVGDRGTLRLFYKTDEVQLIASGGVVIDSDTYETTHLIDNLLDARGVHAPLASALAETGAFMRLVDAVVSAPMPRRRAYCFRRTRRS
ncbi:hypothetical protein [Microbacterium amylolyticum]|uniref:Dehydrogenase n=1 Tax=Microbacterium amylolyticum TaxID=936337 RepID=A0ABS4ZK23_9MICO|nr:hypothetical protein [Microbacterium amylolyticum]MBP2437637.1 putative dehydrogenase [Microbacterium amylolyticum]